jgi:hypothetical protein
MITSCPSFKASAAIAAHSSSLPPQATVLIVEITAIFI